MSQLLLPLAVTSGEPAGIGPDICLALLRSPPAHPLEILVDTDLLAVRAKQLGYEADYEFAQQGKIKGLTLRHVAIVAPVEEGKLNKANAAYVLRLLDNALTGIKTGQYCGLVTAPVHKEVINQAGFSFSGHTEYLRDWCRVKNVVMAFVAPYLKVVALLTTHVPFAKVPLVLTQELVLQTVRILHTALQVWWRIKSPCIALAGLNPHAGEGGYLGKEEEQILLPAMSFLKQEGINVAGPYSADTVLLEPGYDAVVSMYHDQLLPVVKYTSFSQAVNVTLGLPFVRTSVDHGTALSLAGQGGADPENLKAAIDLAAKLVRGQHEKKFNQF